jgi:hypothetical protein
MDDYMKAQAVDQPRMLRTWTWDDSTRIANFMTMHLMQASKYCNPHFYQLVKLIGLDIPIQCTRGLTKEDLK